MIYILEGADGTGKTTLANEIARQRRATVLHPSFHKSWNMAEYHRAFIQAAEALNDSDIDVVLDRWAPSERVYGNVFRNGESFDTDLLINYYYPMLEVTWIYCRNDNAVENHLRNMKNRDEMFDTMEGVVEEFDRYVKEHKRFNWTMYDYDKMDIKEFVKGLPK